MRVVAAFGRVVLGGYLAAHGAQKLFGVLGGHGLDVTGAGFANLGLTPGREMAMLAGASELGGGILTATGIADPLGPVAIAGAMAVATAVHRKNGPFSANGGYELPLTNLALATALVATGPGALRLSRPLPRPVTAAVIAGATAMTGYSLTKLLTHQPVPAPAAVPEPEPDPTPVPEPDVAAETSPRTGHLSSKGQP
jgi:putative oxidoreductase